MQTLERRVSALEQASPEGYTAMFIHFVEPGEVGKEIKVIASDRYTANRKEWTREPGESVHDFHNRAEREAPPSPMGCKVFTCT